MRIILCLLLTFSAGAQVITNVSYLPFTLTVTNQDETIEQFKDGSANTGYRTRRISWSNIVAYANNFSSIVTPGTNTTVLTNTGVNNQQIYTISAQTNNIYSISNAFVYVTNTFIYITNWVVPTVAIKSTDQDIHGSSTNMVNVPELSVSLAAGVYEFRAALWTTNYVAVGSADTVEYTFNGGSATITSMQFEGYYQQYVPGSIFAIAGTFSSSVAFPNSPVLGDNDLLYVHGTLHVSVAGTVIPKVGIMPGGLSTVLKLMKDSTIVYTRLQ